MELKRTEFLISARIVALEGEDGGEREEKERERVHQTRDSLQAPLLPREESETLPAGWSHDLPQPTLVKSPKGRFLIGIEVKRGMGRAERKRGERRQEERERERVRGRRRK